MQDRRCHDLHRTDESCPEEAPGPGYGAAVPVTVRALYRIATLIGSLSCSVTVAEAPAAIPPLVPGTTMYGLPRGGLFAVMPLALASDALALRLSSTKFTGPVIAAPVALVTVTCWA